MADERTVQFWRIVGKGNVDLDFRFPAADVVAKLKAAKTKKLNRYRTSKDGVVTLGDGVSSGATPHVTLYRSRRNNLPHVDTDGTISDLTLANGAGLAEPTHFVFHDRNVVSVLYNNNGPRAGRLVDYLNAKFGCEINLVPIYRQDLAEVLERMRQTRIDVTIPSAQVAQLSASDGDDWVTPLMNAANLINDGVVSLRASIGRRGKADEREAKAGRIKSLANQILGRSDLNKFSTVRVQGTEIGSKAPLSVDLLEQKFILRTEVEAGANGVAPSAAHAVLVKEHQANSGFLTAATPDATGDVPVGTVGDFVSVPADEEDDDGAKQ